MRDYMHPNKGNSGSFDHKDASGRPLDAAGKLINQSARPDLKKTNYVDPNRRPQFKNT